MNWKQLIKKIYDEYKKRVIRQPKHLLDSKKKNYRDYMMKNTEK